MSDHHYMICFRKLMQLELGQRTGQLQTKVALGYIGTGDVGKE